MTSRAARTVKRLSEPYTYPIHQDGTVGAHAFDWFEKVLDQSKARLEEAGYEEYVWIEKKCGDAFCNKSSGHEHYRIPHDDSPFPYEPWEVERIGYRPGTKPACENVRTES